MIMVYVPHLVSLTTNIDHIKIVNTYKIKQIVGINIKQYKYNGRGSF